MYFSMYFFHANYFYYQTRLQNFKFCYIFFLSLLICMVLINSYFNKMATAKSFNFVYYLMINANQSYYFSYYLFQFKSYSQSVWRNSYDIYEKPHTVFSSHIKHSIPHRRVVYVH